VIERIRRESQDSDASSDTAQRSFAPAGSQRPRPAAAAPSRVGVVTLQPKLTVGQAADRFEREADVVADRVVRSLRSAPTPGVDAPDDPGGVPAVQRIQRASTIGAEGGALDAETDRAISATRGGGKAMESGVRRQMESAFGADFSAVRIHEGSQADELNDRIQAKAFAVGNDIYFRGGMSGANSREGQHLLAHELTHTIQQGASPVSRVRRSVTAPATTVSSDSSSKIRRLAYNQNPTTWGAPAGINRRRSGEGAVGVFFANDTGAVFAPGTVVIKPLASSGEVDFANKFLHEGMGFEVPDTVTYPLASNEGQALEALLRADGMVGTRSATEVDEQLGFANRIMVMSVVKGSSMQTLDDGGATEFLRNAPALEQVGRLMVSDAFLGNGDRLVGPTVNLGNFFYAAATAAAPGRITTIDNDSKSGAATWGNSGALTGELQSKIFTLQQLSEAAGQDYFINKFLAKMRVSHVAHPGAIAELDNNAARITADIRTGITRGLADIADVFTNNMDLVRSMGAYSDAASAPKMHVDEAKGAAQYTKALVGGTDPDTAVAQLSTYLAYRQKRSRFPKGLKWMVKAGMDRGFAA
jgi:hypothetical protein